jgi:hypothetical protein
MKPLFYSAFPTHHIKAVHGRISVTKLYLAPDMDAQ